MSLSDDPDGRAANYINSVVTLIANEVVTHRDEYYMLVALAEVLGVMTREFEAEHPKLGPIFEQEIIARVNEAYARSGSGPN